MKIKAHGLVWYCDDRACLEVCGMLDLIHWVLRARRPYDAS